PTAANSMMVNPTRSRIMRAVRSKNTKPEIRVRSALHRAGFRFRIHSKYLPGIPDIVFPARKKAIFVNGCFWHAHGCLQSRPPTSNLEYWTPKLKANKNRDAANYRHLRSLGWRSLTIWECELKAMDQLLAKTIKFLRAKR